MLYGVERADAGAAAGDCAAIYLELDSYSAQVTACKRNMAWSHSILVRIRVLCTVVFAIQVPVCMFDDVPVSYL